MRKCVLVVLVFGLTAGLGCASDEDYEAECGDQCDQRGVTSVSGFVYEQIQGGPALSVPDAELTMTCEGTDEVWTTTSNRYGRYRFQALPTIHWCFVDIAGYAKADPTTIRYSNAVKLNSGSSDKEVELTLSVNDENADDEWTLRDVLASGAE